MKKTMLSRRVLSLMLILIFVVNTGAGSLVVFADNREYKKGTAHMSVI